MAYFSFVVACVVVIVAFITTTTYIQLAGAILLYPLLVFFAYKVFKQQSWFYTSPKKGIATKQSIRSTEKLEGEQKENIGIADIDKRVFLKLIGGAGLFLFFFSIFNKRAESLFFKNMPSQGRVGLEDISGNKIDPAQKHPTDGYNVTEVDDNIIAFYGYTNKEGAWFVMRIDSENGSFRYVKGDSNFPANWNNRAKLKYDYFSNVF